jgi:hypothetical protein
MLDGVKIALGAAAGALVAGLAVFAWASLSLVPAAREEGKALAISDARAAVFQQLKERSETDADAAALPDADLCAALGGVLADTECR